MNWNTLAWEENRTKEEEKIPGKKSPSKTRARRCFLGLRSEILTSTLKICAQRKLNLLKSIALGVRYWAESITLTNHFQGPVLTASSGKTKVQHLQ